MVMTAITVITVIILYSGEAARASPPMSTRVRHAGAVSPDPDVDTEEAVSGSSAQAFAPWQRCEAGRKVGR
jgi:hypothetical protein